MEPEKPIPIPPADPPPVPPEFRISAPVSIPPSDLNPRVDPSDVPDPSTTPPVPAPAAPVPAAGPPNYSGYVPGVPPISAIPPGADTLPFGDASSS